ncbi:MAG: hypothetical protein CMB66_04695 [Euryarchaeota archaeon]|nr:hypothetical protein [Euryarchaeota archaeon]
MDEPKLSGRILKISVISACVAFWPMFAFGDYIGVNPDSLGPLIFTIPAGMVTFLVCLWTTFHSGGKSSYLITISGFVLIGLAFLTFLVGAMESLGSSGDATGPDRVSSFLTFTILGIFAIITGMVVAWFESPKDRKKRKPREYNDFESASAKLEEIFTSTLQGEDLDRAISSIPKRLEKFEGKWDELIVWAEEKHGSQ